MEREKKKRFTNHLRVFFFIELKYGGMDGLKTMMSAFHQFARFGRCLCTPLLQCFYAWDHSRLGSR